MDMEALVRLVGDRAMKRVEDEARRLQQQSPAQSPPAAAPQTPTT
jgi:hypothetical protein